MAPLKDRSTSNPNLWSLHNKELLKDKWNSIFDKKSSSTSVNYHSDIESRSKGGGLARAGSISKSKKRGFVESSSPPDGTSKSLPFTLDNNNNNTVDHRQKKEEETSSMNRTGTNMQLDHGMEMSQLKIRLDQRTNSITNLEDALLLQAQTVNELREQLRKAQEQKLQPDKKEVEKQEITSSRTLKKRGSNVSCCSDTTRRTEPLSLAGSSMDDDTIVTFSNDVANENSNRTTRMKRRNTINVREELTPSLPKYFSSEKGMRRCISNHSFHSSNSNNRNKKISSFLRETHPRRKLKRSVSAPPRLQGIGESISNNRRRSTTIRKKKTKEKRRRPQQSSLDIENLKRSLNNRMTQSKSFESLKRSHNDRMTQSKPSVSHRDNSHHPRRRRHSTTGSTPIHHHPAAFTIHNHSRKSRHSRAISVPSTSSLDSCSMDSADGSVHRQHGKMLSSSKHSRYHTPPVPPPSSASSIVSTEDDKREERKRRREHRRRRSSRSNVRLPLP